MDLDHGNGNRPRVALSYLGCRVNQAEIEDFARSFRRAGFAIAGADDSAEVFVLNTCTITHVADHKARLFIRQAGRRNPHALIVITGCYAAVDPAAVAAIEGVDLVVPNSDKARLVEMVLQHVPALPPRTDHGDPAVMTLPAAARTRSTLKVQDGCDYHCTYCIVPRARGASRSVPPDSIIADVQRRVDLGFREIVLTGVALGSYGREWDVPPHGSRAGRRLRPSALPGLVEGILQRTQVQRLRLSSMEPENLDPAMLEVWRSDGRLCRHLHLPLQSGCDATLKRMGRRYRSADYAALVAQARAIAPDAAITTDMIVGFPGETDEEWEESLAFAERMAFAKIHVFRFSAREGTAAIRLPGVVPEQTKKERAARLLALTEQQGYSYRSGFLGSLRQVLWEEETRPQRRHSAVAATAGTNRLWNGLTDNYIRVYTESSNDLRNQFSIVRLEREHADGLWGVIQTQEGS